MNLEDLIFGAKLRIAEIGEELDACPDKPRCEHCDLLRDERRDWKSHLSDLEADRREHLAAMQENTLNHGETE